MQYTHLGRAAAVVSRIGLGTMNFSTKCTESDSMKIMDRAFELGINFFDTANNYGRPKWEGVAERIVGKWLAGSVERRRRTVLATKVYTPMGPTPNEARLSAINIRAACEESLRRLGTDHIDLYYLHHIDRGDVSAQQKGWESLPDLDLYRPSHRKPETRWEEILGAFDTLVGQGKVLYLGTSNYPAWSIAQGCEKSLQRHFLGPVCEQSRYSLAFRQIESEVIPACREYGVGLAPYGPLRGGLLAGRPGVGDEAGRRSDALKTADDVLKSRMDAYFAFCAELGAEPAAVALAWLLRNPVVTAPIVGPRTVGQIEDSVKAFDVKLGSDALKRLDEIWPGPGGEAPEAYAW